MPSLKRYKYHYLRDKAGIAWRRDRPVAIAVDTETSGLTWEDRPFCVTLAWEGNAHYVELDDYSYAMLKYVLENTPTLVFHNAKFDLRMLINEGLLDRSDLDADRIEDTEALAHLLDENRLKGLKYLAKTLLGETTDEDEKLKVVRRKLKLKKEDGYAVIPRHILVPYAIKDADFTFRLWSLLRPQLDAFSDLQSLYRQEMALALVLLDMETAGLGVDSKYVQQQVVALGTQIIEAEQQICKFVGKPIGDTKLKGKPHPDYFNPNSPEQLKKALEARGVVVPNTDKNTLGGLNDPLAKAVLHMRGLAKLRSTYLLPLRTEAKGGILHPSFRQHGTRTGRLSSGAERG